MVAAAPSTAVSPASTTEAGLDTFIKLAAETVPALITVEAGVSTVPVLMPRRSPSLADSSGTGGGGGGGGGATVSMTSSVCGPMLNEPQGARLAGVVAIK